MSTLKRPLSFKLLFYWTLLSGKIMCRPCHQDEIVSAKDATLMSSFMGSWRQTRNPTALAKICKTALPSTPTPSPKDSRTLKNSYAASSTGPSSSKRQRLRSISQLIWMCSSDPQRVCFLSNIYNYSDLLQMIREEPSSRPCQCAQVSQAVPKCGQLTRRLAGLSNIYCRG